MTSVVVAAGGTGGHISPGVALAEVLQSKKEELGFSDVFLHSIRRNSDNPDLKTPPCDVIWHNTPSFTSSKVLFPIRFAWNFIQTILEFRKRKVEAVIGMGGYSSVPAILYAIVFGKKFFLCEQNRVLGNVNRLFGKRAQKLALSFPLQEGKEQWKDSRVLGNPLRRKIIPKIALKQARQIDPKKKNPLNVLVLGGSQGARQINNMVLSAMKNETVARSYKFRLLTGANLYSEVAQKSKDADLISYAENMEDHYEWANLVIARAGAGVLSECSAYSLPMILIPYPFAKDNHQKYNADYFSSLGAAVSIDQKTEDDTKLVQILLEMSNNLEELNRMALASLSAARINAAAETVHYFFPES